MPSKKKKTTKKGLKKKINHSERQSTTLFADFNVLSKEKKEEDDKSTSLTPDIKNEEIISKLGDKSDKDSPKISPHISHTKAAEIVNEDGGEETAESSLELEIHSEDDEGWQTVGKKSTKKTKKKKANNANGEYANIAELYNYDRHERDKESIDLVYKRYKLFKSKKWNPQSIRASLKAKSNGKCSYDDLKLGEIFENREKILPQEETYQKFYLLSGAAGELIDGERPGTPRIVLSSTGNEYFCNHYKKFINVMTGDVFEKKEK